MNRKLWLGVGIFAMFMGGLWLTGEEVQKQMNSSIGCTAMSFDGEIDPKETVAFFEGKSVPVLMNLADESLINTKVLGLGTGEKWIEVDLSDQMLIAWEGDREYLRSAISSGLWTKTPVGEHEIWYKIRSTKMEGGSKLNNTYYYLPNVPYAMFFKGDFGIHGTYWHSNFGQPMSRGCVNAPTDVAGKLFYWVDPQLPEGKKAVRATDDNPGTRVVVHD